MFPDQDIVAVLKGAAVDPGVIDIGPVQGVVIFDYELVFVPIDFCVMAGDGEVIDLNHVVGKSAYGGYSLGKWNFLQHRLLKL